MASCAERQRLVEEYEAALDEYIGSLKRSLGSPSDSFERHKILLRCREALTAHCLGHGCDREGAPAKTADA
jgi:hypothetical protein